VRGAAAGTYLRHRVGRRRAGIRHSRVAPRHSTVPRDQPSPFKGCGTPVATALSRTMSRLQPRVATHWEILLRPDVGEGRNNVLKRSWCACPTFESVHAPLRSSRVIEEQSEGQHRWGEQRRVPRGPATPCHVRKRAVLYAYGDVLVRSGEWPILVPFILSENEFAHRPLRSGWEAWQH
jgi:hypothetical protein